MTATKKSSGRNIDEDERNTVAVKLRLRPEVADQLRAIAMAWRRPMGDVIEPALVALLKSSHEIVGG